MTIKDLETVYPLLIVIGWACVLLLVDLFIPKDRKGWTAFLAAVGLTAALGFTIAYAGEEMTGFSGMVTLDRFGSFLNGLFLASGLLGVAIAYNYLRRMNIERGEYYMLILFSTAGMMLMAQAADLVIIFLALELLSLPLYVLSAFARPHTESEESGLKYFLLGAFSTGFVVYGIALVYGATGTTSLAGAAAAITEPGFTRYFLLIGAALILVGFGFKVAAVPFHMWAPDVYQGAPSTVTAFLSTASKAAGFAALLRVFGGSVGTAAPEWVLMVAVLAALSMIVGNLLAIPQRDIKRMLAYSGLAQAGYALVGLASPTPLGKFATIFFLFQYLFTNLGAFLIVSIIGRGRNEDEIVDYNGLHQRNPVLAFALLLLLLSLGGIPPLSGFWGKVLVFWAAIDSGQYGLVFIGVLASVVSLYYYLMVARALYIEPAEARPPAKVSYAAAVAVCVCVLLVVGLAYPAPVLHLARQAAVVLSVAGHGG